MNEETKYAEFFTGNILIYDKDNIMYWSSQPLQMYRSTDFTKINSITDTCKTRIPLFDTITFQTTGFNKTDTITLDPTTMKRIAKYNKETECKKLDEQIKKKKEQIKELDDKLKDKEKRWEKVKNYIANIYEIDIDDYEEENYD